MRGGRKRRGRVRKGEGGMRRRSNLRLDARRDSIRCPKDLRNELEFRHCRPSFQKSAVQPRRRYAGQGGRGPREYGPVDSAQASPGNRQEGCIGQCMGLV